MVLSHSATFVHENLPVMELPKPPVPPARVGPALRFLNRIANRSGSRTLSENF